MSQTLNFDRTELVKSLKDALAKKEADRKEAADKITAKAADDLGKINSLVESCPEFGAWIVQHVKDYWTNDLDKLEDQVRRSYPGCDPDSPAQEYDKDLKRLIRTYEAASDTQVELEVGDSVLNYI